MLVDDGTSDTVDTRSGETFLVTPADDRVRRVAIERLLDAAIRGSLHPLSRRELLGRVDLLLQASWADVTSREVEKALDALNLEEIETDNQGRYYVDDMPRTLDEAMTSLAESARCLAVLEETEGSDCETVRNRQVASLFRHPLLEPHDEKVLASLAAHSTEARNELMLANLRLARSVSTGWAPVATNSVDDDDLFQEACLGLLRASEKFDPHLGYRFSTYASWWLRQGVARALADKGHTIRRPVHVVDRIARLRRTTRQLGATLAREPTDHEILKALDMTVEQLAETEAASALECVALEELSEDAELRVVGSLVTPFEEAVVTNLLQDSLNAYMEELDERSREVVDLRLGLNGTEPLTLAAIGDRLGVSRERVRQIETQALKNLVALGVVGHQERRGPVTAA